MYNVLFLQSVIKLSFFLNILSVKSKIKSPLCLLLKRFFYYTVYLHDFCLWYSQLSTQ